MLPNGNPWPFAKYVLILLPLHKRSSAIVPVSIYNIQDLRNAEPIGIYKICTAPCRHQLRGNTTHCPHHRPRHGHGHGHRPPPWVQGYGHRSVHY